ncbi:MAG: RhuM family protein, partial [Desulfuromonadales bacterium]
MSDKVVLYQSAEGKASLDVRLEKETVWLNLNQVAELFGRDKSVVSRHVNNVFREGELARDSVVANFATTAADGKTYQVDYFNLDVIISVGYRVKSLQGTR